MTDPDLPGIDVSSAAVETAAVAAIRDMTPLCFQNLLSRECDAAIDDCVPADRAGVSIDPLIGSIERRKDVEEEGVLFSILGRLKAGAFRQIDVRVIGIQTADGVGFKSVQKAYDRQGRPPADVFAVAA